MSSPLSSMCSFSSVVQYCGFSSLQYVCMYLHLILCFNSREMLRSLIFSQDPIDQEVRKNSAGQQNFTANSSLPMQMPQSYWLSFCTLSVVGVPRLEVIYDMAVICTLFSKTLFQRNIILVRIQRKTIFISLVWDWNQLGMQADASEYHKYRLLTKCEVKMAEYWPSACLWIVTTSRSINS